MKENKKTLVSIKEIIFIVLALLILGITINLFYTGNINTQIGEVTIEENNQMLQENNELIVTQIAEETEGIEVTSRGQTEIRSNEDESQTEENEEGQVFTEVEVSWEEPIYKTIDEVTISRDMDLTVGTGLSKEGFKELIGTVKEDTSKFFYDNAETIYDLCEQYELNEIFFCGLISAESGWNIASNHRNTNNFISLMVNGKLLKYDSVEEGLEVAAKSLHNNYLTPGGKFYYGKTLSSVKTKFCPASSTWVDLVYGRMKQIMY